MDPQRDHPLRGSWEWLAFAARLPAKPLTVNAPAAPQRLYSGRCLLTGMCLYNSAAVGAAVVFYDGTDTNGLAAGQIHFAATSGNFGPLATGPILLESGLVLSPGAGTVVGAVYVIPLDVHFGTTPPGE